MVRVLVLLTFLSLTLDVGVSAPRGNYGYSARVQQPASSSGSISINAAAATAVLERPVPVVSSSSSPPSPPSSSSSSSSPPSPPSLSTHRANTNAQVGGYGLSARVRRPPAPVAVVSTSPITSSANTAAVASSPLPVVAAVPSAAVVETHPRDADADADAALVAERQSVAQLQTLLVAFETSQLDRLKLVSLEEAEVARIADVQAQPQHDAGTREELAAWRARKVASIAAEREVANEMGHCVAGLRDEIAAGTAATTASPGASRDERVLALINRFDAAAARRSLTADAAVPATLATILRRTNPAATPVFKGLSVTPGATVAQISASLRVKSNEEIASAAGTTLAVTGSSLVDATSAVVTTVAGFVFSDDSKTTRDALASATDAVWASIKALRTAVTAAAKAYQANEPSQSEGELSVARVVAGIKGVYASSEFQEAVGILGTNAQKSAVQAAKAATSAADKLSTSLGQSPKYLGAYKVLSESLLTLLAILGAAASRAAEQMKADKQLPSSIDK